MSEQPFFNKSRYLKGRPFLVIETIERPAATVNTSVKGWRNDPANIDLLESPSVVDRINDKQMRATCVIDILNTKVVKSRVPGRTDEELLSYYLNRFKDIVTQAIGVWAKREALNEAQVREAIDVLTAPEAVASAA